MSKVQIYGNVNSRASRVTWCARELGVDHEFVDVGWDKQKQPEFLAINPNGKFPGFADGDLKMFESLAINLYLAKKFGTGGLYPTNLEDEARVMQWTLWAATEVEPNAFPALMLALGYSKDEAAAKAGEEKLKAPLKVLDDALKGKQWLVGDKFSVADLNVACVVNMLRAGKIDFSYAPNVVAWHTRCNARPARNPN